MSQATSSQEVQKTVDTYCAAWGEPDAMRRRALLDAACAAHVVYTDPRVATSTAGALLDHIAGVLAKRPGARIVRTSAVDAHHDLARFAWQVVSADGAALLDGVDIVEFAGGKIVRIVGFFGELAAA